MDCNTQRRPHHIGSLHVSAGANTTYLLNAISLNGIDFATYLDTHCAAGGKS